MQLLFSAPQWGEMKNFSKRHKLVHRWDRYKRRARKLNAAVDSARINIMHDPAARRASYRAVDTCLRRRSRKRVNNGSI